MKLMRAQDIKDGLYDENLNPNINIYYYSLNRKYKKIPKHRPIWTCIVPSFVIPDMRIEIEVEAYKQ